MRIDTKPTRAERQAQTRERLIDVARELFLNDGYASTSLDKVAVAAGFSKGAVYSNFSGKEELCMDVLDSIRAEQVDGVLAAFTVDADLDGRIDAFADWAREKLGQPKWTALEVEFAAVARHSPWVAAELSKRHRALVDASTHLLANVTKEAGYEISQRQARGAATALLSMGIGLGALRALDSGVDVEALANTMRALLRVTRA